MNVQIRGLLDFLKTKGFHVGRDEHQLAYVMAIASAIGKKDLPDSENSIFVDAPAGTGKTTLAALIGAYAVDKGMADRLLYLRTEDSVLSGSDRGALPGDDDEKNEPYKAPFVEALDLFSPGLYEKWSGRAEEEEEEKKGRKQNGREDEEKQPKKSGPANKFAIQAKAKALATHPGYIRGKTRENTIVLLDEAQNWRRGQLQATYTRFKNNCVIITMGHSGQCDIPPHLQERVAGLLPFNMYARHHQKKGAWVGTLVNNYRGQFAQWSDEIDVTIRELEQAQLAG